jgi:hypothetical protein
MNEIIRKSFDNASILVNQKASQSLIERPSGVPFLLSNKTQFFLVQRHSDYYKPPSLNSFHPTKLLKTLHSLLWYLIPLGIDIKNLFIHQEIDSRSFGFKGGIS